MRARPGSRGERSVVWGCDASARRLRDGTVWLSIAIGVRLHAARAERRAAARPQQRQPRPSPRDSGDDRLQRPHQPDGRPLRLGRPRVRRREERADQGLRQRVDTDADGVRRTCATNVHNFWDRGLLGMALHPNFPTTPYVYVLYTTTAARRRRVRAGPAGGRTRARRRRARPPTAASSAAASRVSQAAGNVMTGTEQVLVEDWCQQYPSHSVGTRRVRSRRRALRERRRRRELQLRRLRAGRQPSQPLRRSAGRRRRGADPAHGRRGRAAQPGSAYVRRSGLARRLDHPRRSRDRRGLPSNPLAGNSDANARRIIAHGLRNPFRFTFRPGTSELWVGDVGWDE